MSDFDAIDWIHRFDPTALDDRHLAQAKRCLLDLLGVAAAATQTKLATIATRYAQSQHAGSRPLLFAKGYASETGAALHGAWLIDAFDAHDGQVLTKGHAGVAILPGLLAFAETEKLSGREFLGFMTLGYEVATRAGIALHDSTSDYHTSGAWNALGVAAIGGKLLGLAPRQLREAMGIAEFYGPRSQMMRCIDHPTMVKDGSGWGTMGGVAAALLARDGFTGAPAVTVTEPCVKTHWEDLGQRWYLHEQYFKAYPVCRWAQPAVEAVLSLAQKIGSIEQIETIDIHTFHEAACLATANPETTEQAQYSLPWPVACALIDGRVDAAAITSKLDSPEWQALARRVTTHRHADYDARFPAERWAHAVIGLRNGRCLESVAFEARGNPSNPLSDMEIEQKYHQLAEPVLGERSEGLKDTVMTLESRPLSDLLPWLRLPESP